MTPHLNYLYMYCLVAYDHLVGQAVADQEVSGFRSDSGIQRLQFPACSLVVVPSIPKVKVTRLWLQRCRHSLAAVPTFNQVTRLIV